MYRIRCPYCFTEFDHDEVHFRLAEAACQDAQNNLEEIERTEELEEDSEAKKERLSEFVKREEIDPKFYEVWGDLRGGKPSDNAMDLFHVPWVDQFNKAEMIVGDYITDQDGFVEKIVDQCGHFESKTRICPHCHNKLPLHYGKNPQKFISILGVSTSGKTVYLKQLLKKIQNPSDGILSHVNGSFVELTLPDDDKTYLKKDKPLPPATPTVNFKVPFFVTMTFEKDKEKTMYDFVIYDVAGETLVKLARENPNRFQFFAGYIKCSDAMIVLIDPMQLVSDPQPEWQASEMITTLYSVFGAQVHVPTAITISKSDLLLTNESIRGSLVPDDLDLQHLQTSPIARNIPWSPEKRFFYLDEYSSLKSRLDKIYDFSAKAFKNGVKQQIEKPAFFIVSALWDGVDQMLTFELSSKTEWKSHNLDDYINKFPILRKQLDDIKFDLEEQESDPDKSIINANNINVKRSFVFGQNDAVAARLDRILGKISTLRSRTAVREAVYSQFDRDDSLELLDAKQRDKEDLSMSELIKYIHYLNEEMDDCVFHVYLQGYPRRNGNLKSLRIEEPFFWLLSEMEIINRGNLYPQNEQNGSKRQGKSRKCRLFGGKKS